MKELLRLASESAIVLIDAMALVIVVYGAIEAFANGVKAVFGQARIDDKRAMWLRFMRWLVLALSFQLAADIIETSISTTTESLVRIGVIAVIRTFLNYFLERDVGEVMQRQSEDAA
jgi:uncharacterized membrane protein